MQIYGMEALIRLICHFLFIYLTFWSMQSLKLEELFKKNYQSQVRTFYIVLSIGIGYTASSFFFEVLILSKNFILPFTQ